MSNNPYGYRLTGNVGSTSYAADALYNTVDTTKTFSSIGFGTNKATLNDFSPNTWGYSYSTDGGTTWLGYNGATGYTGLPMYNSINTVTFLDTSDISAETGDTMKFKLGAKASSDKESGEYNNIINFVATGYNFPLYTVTYNANGGTVSPTEESTRSSVTLPTPTYSGYNFQGWCDGTVASSTCSGTTYQAGDTYTPVSSVTLTAMWEPAITTFDSAFAAAGKSKSGDYYAMLDMTSSICSAVNTGEVGTLVDTRDNNTYKVGKLADGKCWMLDNLAFNGKNNKGSGSYITMNSNNTHINTTKTWSDTVRTSWSNTYTASKINDASKDVVSSNAKDQAGQWKVGVYYNYCAATLGTICSSDASTVASYDVCPKGWKLPAGNTGGDFRALYNRSEYNTYDKYRDALRLPLSGYFLSGTPNSQGSNGRWWSTTAYDGPNRYGLYVSTSGISPTIALDRRDGNSIRCIGQ